MMQNNIVPIDVAKKVFEESGLACIGKSGIREINKLARDLEAASGKKFIHILLRAPEGAGSRRDRGGITSENAYKKRGESP